MKKLFLLIAVCLISFAASAEVIKGHVKDAGTGEPLIGATVQPVGGGQGTATDIDGNFSLNVASNVKLLNVSYVGYNSQQVGVINGAVIALESQDNTLDEVMVVAYGQTKKSSFTGSAEAVKADKLELRPVTSATKALEGNVSGVQFAGNSGQPGSTPKLHIRGFGSINASSTPLYVVDGIPYDGDLASINPADIEQMTVLKDASASALYGARGANGVVMIATKKGKEGDAQVTWRSNFGWSSRANKRYQNVDQKEYVQLTYEALRNQYVFNDGLGWADAEAAARANLSETLGGEQYNPFKNYTWGTIIDPATGQVRSDAQSAWNEDWLDAVTRNNAFRTEHQFSVNGGSAKTKYNFSLGYLNEDGVLQTTKFERYSARVGVDSQIKDWFNANINVNLAHSKQNASDFTGSQTSNPWYTAQFINPLFPVYLKDANGNTVYDEEGNVQYDWSDITKRPGSLSDFNSLGSLMLDKTDYLVDAAGLRTGMVFGSDKDTYGWAQGLKFAVNFGVDYDNTQYTRYYNSKHGNQASAGGLLYKSTYRTQSYTFNQLLTWNRAFGSHNLDFLVGHEYYCYRFDYLNAGKTNLVDGILELRPGTSIIAADSYSRDYRINSFLSRFNYNYAGRYYLSASIRTDASSRFHKDHHNGTFWSVGANWRVSSESFMKDVKWVNNLSVKAAYGEQGNDAVGTYYAWQSLYDLDFANANNKGGFISTLENQTISWEKNGNFNVGIEGLFFNSRVKLNAEWYYKKTKNMLLNYPMALSTGFSGYKANAGNMRNQGLELEIGVTPVRNDDFEWNVNLFVNTISNKVLKLTNDAPEITSGIYSTKVGSPINTFHLTKSAGVDPATGAELYWSYESLDENGNPVGEFITSDFADANAHRYYLGSRMPDLFGSIGTDFRYKNFTLSVLTTYSIGGKVYDGTYNGCMSIDYISSTWNKNVLRRWQQPGDVTDVPRIEIAGTSISTDRYLIDASYFAVKNITLSYTLPSALAKKAHIKGARVFGSVDNLCLFTHLDGMDPQYNFTGSTGYDYSPNKTFQVGFELNF